MGATANGVDDAVNALGGAGSTLLAGGAFTSYRGAGSLTRALLVLDAATGSLR